MLGKNPKNTVKQLAVSGTFLHNEPGINGFRGGKALTIGEVDGVVIPGSAGLPGPTGGDVAELQGVDLRGSRRIHCERLGCPAGEEVADGVLPQSPYHVAVLEGYRVTPAAGDGFVSGSSS